MVDELGKAKEATVEVEIVIYDVETSKAVNKAVLNRDCTFGGFSDNGASECVNFDLWIERLIK
ncbi:MAG: hypothetical protein BWY78_01478 [Alphaproteobacteria bacterium ADurb.Bin438]|nr:MAG: hypothetical protein BWY78_01478 [Alphaproteobacteria bacterium ADurb.Bin438]